MSILTLRKPIDFSHSNHAPVEIVVCLAAINNHSHVKALMQFMQMFKKLRHSKNDSIRETGKGVAKDLVYRVLETLQWYIDGSDKNGVLTEALTIMTSSKLFARELRIIIGALKVEFNNKSIGG